ncbi:MAG: MBOAT family protein, partial [Ruminococcus sp.]|nr:MBOAT family protein [Ruminococcus sp.]
MIYSSLLFIYCFLPVSLVIYWITPSKLKNISLLILSIVFCTVNSLRFLEFMV